jgi:hypothetical protein
LWWDKELIGIGACREGMEPEGRRLAEYKEGDRKKNIM